MAKNRITFPKYLIYSQYTETDKLICCFSCIIPGITNARLHPMVDHAELKVGLEYQNNLPVDWDEIVPFSSLRHFTCRNLTILD